MGKKRCVAVHADRREGLSDLMIAMALYAVDPWQTAVVMELTVSMNMVVVARPHGGRFARCILEM